MHLKISSLHIHTIWQQSKMFLTIDERGLKLARNSVFNYHLSPVGRQIAIKNCFYDFFSKFVDSVNIFNCCLSIWCYIIAITLLNNVSVYIEANSVALDQTAPADNKTDSICCDCRCFKDLE